MNAARRAARAGRNLLIALLIGAAVIVAIVIAYVAGRSSGSTAAGPTSAPVTTVTAISTGSSDPGAAPSGCLGGGARNFAMLANAQKSAPHSAYGAVEMATAFFRWAYRYPYPSSAESKEVSQDVIADNASAAFKDVARSYASAGDITDGQVAKGKQYYLSTTNGLWVIRSGSTANRVTVDLNAAYVIDGAVSPTKTAAISATLVWSNNAWRVLSEQQPATAALSSGGTQFTAGC